MTQVIILAGGKGTRMNASHPKVLTKINGRFLIERVLENAIKVCPKPSIIVGFKGREIIETLGDKYHYIWQKEQLGTGHAVMQAKKDFEKRKDIKNVIVLPGDHIFASEKTLRELIRAQNEKNCVISVATLKIPNFSGSYANFWNFGRIIRNTDGNIAKICEFKDANEDERRTREINISFYSFNSKWLWDNINKLENKNKSKEYYLTDMVALAISQGFGARAVAVEDIKEATGVNTMEQLKAAEKILCQ